MTSPGQGRKHELKLVDQRDEQGVAKSCRFQEVYKFEEKRIVVMCQQFEKSKSGTLDQNVSRLCMIFLVFN